MIAQWDGIDNVGTGKHDPNSLIWKDLKGDIDLTIDTSRGAWNTLGNALCVNRSSARGSKAAPAYKTIELVCRPSNCKGISDQKILFNGGNSATRQMVIMNVGQAKFCFSGVNASALGGHVCAEWDFNPATICCMAATFTNSAAVAAAVYAEGVEVDGTSTVDDSWSGFNSFVNIGDRYISDNPRPWFGEVFAIRLYDVELTPEEIAANHAIDIARFSSSARYVQDGLVAQWDGIDNAGMGNHNPTARIWKDLVGGYDLYLTNNAAWNSRGTGLVVSNISAVCDSVAPDYKTIEIVYSMSKIGGRILFSGGSNTKFVLFDNPSTGKNRVYFTGHTYDSGTKRMTMHFLQPFVANSVCFAAALRGEAEEYSLDGTTQRTDPDPVVDIYCDGERKIDGMHVNGWWCNANTVLGGRVSSKGIAEYAWYGEVYAIRLYSRRLTRAELARNNMIDRARFASSGSYVQSDIIGQWDGIDNANIGVHNPNATTWMDLRSNRNLTLTTNGTWNASRCGLATDGVCGAASASSAGPAAKTLEVAYKMTSGRILYSSGASHKQMVVFDGSKGYFSGVNNNASLSFHPYVNWTADSSAVRSMAATWTNTSWTAAYVYGDGTKRNDGLLDNDWGTGDGKMVLGDRTTGKAYPWKGEIYALRLYDRILSDEDISFDSALDRKRVALAPKTVEWGGSSGSFTNGTKWTGGALPRINDDAVIASGTAALDDDYAVGSLSVGDGGTLSLSLPSESNATSRVVFSVFGKVAAESGAKLALDAAAFGRRHPEESITVLECSTPSAEALETLADGLTFVNTDGKRQGTLAVVDGVRLVYTAPAKPGTMIIIN